MINAKVLNMIGALNRDSLKTLNIARGQTIRTEDFEDLESLDMLYSSGWVNGYPAPEEDTCLWILTDDGRKMLEVLEDIII